MPQKYASSSSKKKKKKKAETVGISLGAVNRILKQSKEAGNVEIRRKRKCGRKRKMTEHDDAKLLHDSKRNPWKTSEELKRELDESGVQILSSTIRWQLLAQGRKARRPKRKQLLTTDMKKGTTGQKNTKTGLKMIGAKFSFQTKVVFLFKDSMQNLYAVQRSCDKNILSKRSNFIQRTQTKRCFGDAFLLMDQVPSYWLRAC